MKATRRLAGVWAALAAGLLAADSARAQAAATNVTPPASMALIPAGTNKGESPDAGPYDLKVEAFYMDRHEVSKALWDEVLTWARAHGYGIGDGAGKAPDHPVQRVNWYDVVKWCNARSEKEGRPVCYRLGSDVYRTGVDAGLPPNGLLRCDPAVAGHRLPTDAEWEYAARGGLRGKRYPWGDTIDHARANYFGFPFGYAYDKGPAGNNTRFATGEQPFTAPVGSFPANAYGLHDMTGNVWEWCWDWSPTAPNAHRTIRGGAWSYPCDYGRLSSRADMYPEFSYWSVGFRCAMTAVK
jgi:formylglycine-generating enzyme